MIGGTERTFLQRALDVPAPWRPLVRGGLIAWAIIGIAIVAYGLLLLAIAIRPALVALAVALLLVALLEPIVSRLERRRIPRIAGVPLALVGVMLPIAAGMWWLARMGISQLDELLSDLPGMVDRADAALTQAWDWLAARGVPLPADDPATWLAEQAPTIRDRIFGLLTAAMRAAVFLSLVVIGLIIGALALLELPKITASLRRGLRLVLPEGSRRNLVEGTRIVTGTAMAFVRGQLLIAILVGVMSTVGLVLLGVPYAVLVGVIAGVTNLVPFFGPIVGSVPGVLLGWAEGGFVLAIWVVVMFVIVQQFESQVLSPVILGTTLRLSPFWVMLGMLAGAVSAGLLGMILAVPGIASIKRLWLRFGPRRGEAAT